ncbi:hypothetical protein CONPUDRAFT_157727 [Coniophora puteana RWD-64-598 SS2]|uniref:F-box domain-containing protein n=1 Tax=Coniophora puteana (strain RWD-64-598) TaxID=741705 RepID=A0A5M3MBB5_CONPW|nr:uncharacterized protein CONPUDRAFT_157727 [Coniophora puteana RWD-64-598 SS2]EIW76539.1 hypothetical protein CONPUDRAFT_157727 [Coniophora puteana RWD-64-598 SS2]
MLAEMSLVKQNLENICSAVTASIQQLSGSMTSYSRFVAAVTRLPDEILSEIFERACAPSDMSFTSSGHTSWRDASLTSHRLVCADVSQVCQRWRRVALATPRLWTAFSLNVHKRTIWALPIPLEMIERASSMPVFLSFTLRASDYENIPPLAITDGGSNIALGKVKGVDVDAYSTMHISDILDWLPAFPRLQRLRLKGVSTRNWPWDEPPSWLRRLTHLHLKLTDLRSAETLLAAPGGAWDSLVSLTLEDAGVLDPLPILTSFPRLEELFLLSAMSLAANPNQGGGGGGTQPPIVVHARLRRLSLCIRARQRVAPFFAGMALPALRRLGVCAETGEWMHAGALVLDALVERSRCRLESLVLSAVHTPFARETRELAERFGERWGVPDVRVNWGEREEMRYVEACKADWYS